MKEIAIHTPTKEDYNTLMKILERQGREWIGGKKPTKFAYWVDYGEKTCIAITAKGLLYSSKDYYKCEGYKILSLQEYLTSISETPNGHKEVEKSMKFKIKQEGEEIELFLAVGRIGEIIVGGIGANGINKSLLVFRDGKFYRSKNAGLKGIQTDEEGRVIEEPNPLVKQEEL